MNAFAIVILAALLADFALDVTANLLNLKALRLEPPPAVADIYKPEEYRRSQEYTRTTTRFGLVTDAFRLLLLLAFWFSGGFSYLDLAVRSWGFIPIVSGLLFIGILWLAFSLLMLPFSVYAVFVIEERFGFNRTTPGVFVMDRLKGLGLSVLLGVPLVAGILALFEYAGGYAWVYCWAAVTVFTLVVQFVAPVWIMPLFNRFTPMPEGELKDAILRYALSVGYRVGGIFVMDGSRRSSRSNAFFTGFGRTKRIALFDTLISAHTVPEMVAILAHEIGHYKKKHIPQGMVIGIAHTGLVFFLLSIFLNSPGLYQAFYMQQPSVYAGLLFFGLLYIPVEMFLSIAMQMVSRHHEYEADRFAAQTVEKPGSLVSALKKLYAHNLSNLTPHPFYVFLNYSHPPLLQRVTAIERYSGSKQKTGEVRSPSS